jgi:hypothetical protein
MNQCPRRAIETAHGFVVGVSLLVSLATRALVAPAVGRLAPSWATPRPGTLSLVALENLLALGVLFLAYRLLHRALRFPAVERLVVATSLTHFAFWRRYRAPSVPPPASPSDHPG